MCELAMKMMCGNGSQWPRGEPWEHTAEAPSGDKVDGGMGSDRGPPRGSD